MSYAAREIPDGRSPVPSSGRVARGSDAPNRSKTDRERVLSAVLIAEQAVHDSMMIHYDESLRLCGVWQRLRAEAERMASAAGVDMEQEDNKHLAVFVKDTAKIEAKPKRQRRRKTLRRRVQLFFKRLRYKLTGKKRKSCRSRADGTRRTTGRASPQLSAGGSAGDGSTRGAPPAGCVVSAGGVADEGRTSSSVGES